MEMMLNIDVVEQLGSPMIRFAIGANAVVLNVNEVEDLIAWMARCRSGMLPSVTEQPRSGAVMAAENEPLWDIKHDAQADSAVLMLRHSGFGWLGFKMSEQNLQSLDDAIRGADNDAHNVVSNRLN